MSCAEYIQCLEEVFGARKARLMTNADRQYGVSYHSCRRPSGSPPSGPIMFAQVTQRIHLDKPGGPHKLELSPLVKIRDFDGQVCPITIHLGTGLATQTGVSLDGVVIDRQLGTITIDHKGTALGFESPLCVFITSLREPGSCQGK
jgi:hypothetical protein